MENIDLIKLYSFLSFIIILLLWKFWKDFEFKNRYFTAVDKFNENQNTLLKEVEALSIEITDIGAITPFDVALKRGITTILSHYKRIDYARVVAWYHLGMEAELFRLGVI